MLTFVIPIRHPANSKDWQALKRNLVQTVTAIARQEHDAWRAVVVANTGADLPPLPPRFEIKRVEFPPNNLHELQQADRETVYEAFRWDKGRRVLAGMLHARATDDSDTYFMIVDDDDFVSCKLAGFVASHQGANGWYLETGYVWSEGGRTLYRHPAFHKFCGTSHIVRADLMELPARFEDASETYIKRMLGSHIFIDDYMRSKGAPLAPLPFFGAVYRIGHAGAHSKSGRLLKTFVLQRRFIKRPWLLVRNILRLQPLTPRLGAEFFGSHGV